MFHLRRSWVVVIAAGLAVACTACQSKTAQKPAGEERRHAAERTKTERTAGGAARGEAEHKTAAAQAEAAEPPPPPPTIPKVALSDALRAACLVKVGDTMPEAELPDPAGKLHALDSLYGQKLTVVCFWTIGTTHRSRLVAAAALQDLMKEVAEPFGEKGVRVIGINVGDAADEPSQQEHAARRALTFPNLLDPKGEFFAKIAKDRQDAADLPARRRGQDPVVRRRVFPLRRGEDLVQGIRVALGEL